MSVFENLQRAEFAGLQFPVKRIRLRGGLRMKLHEFPHAPGAAIEKLGRKPYEIEMDPILDARVRGYPSRLWPEVAASLRSYHERGVTDTLVIPTVGPIQAVAKEWDETATSKQLSGVQTTLHYVEDASDTFITDDIVQVAATDISTRIFVCVVQARTEDLSMGFFDAIKALGDQILSYKDQVDLQADLIAAKAEGIASLCAQADAQLDSLKEPAHFRVAAALHDVWDSAIKLQKDALGKALPTIDWVVPVPMGVGDIAAALYGDASRAVEVMKMNPLPDPLYVLAGTKLKVIAP